jgi:teichuronic acid exporter
LITLTKVMGLTFVINSFWIIQRTILTKKMDFRTQALINLGGIGGSSMFGLYLAQIGYGVWALVYQTLTNNVITMVLYWKFGGWRPSRVFCRSSFSGLFAFGSKLLLAGLIDTLYNNVYQFLIGRLYNAQSLGYYSRAKQMQGSAVMSLTQCVQSVTYPLFAKMQENSEQLKKGFQRVIRVMAFGVLPFSALLFLIVEPFVRLTLTMKWLPIVGLIQLLCMFGWLYPFHAINLNLLKVKGRSDLVLRLEVVKRVIMTISIAITVPFGIKAMICGQMVCSVIAYYLNSYYSGRLINYPWRQQLRDIRPFFVATLIMFGLVYLIAGRIDNDLLRIVISICSGVAIYIGITHFSGCQEVKMIGDLLMLKTHKGKSRNSNAKIN